VDGADQHLLESNPKVGWWLGVAESMKFGQRIAQ
jgi:hypothetical protein